MDHHVNLRLLPSPEIAQPHLMSALFGKLHRALAAHQGSDIGVSFPHVGPQQLGDLLRLHGMARALDTLLARPWLGGVNDHVEVGGLLRVPAQTGCRCVRRVQAKSSAARLRRRLMRRHGCSEAEARQRIGDEVEQRLDLPFVSMQSASTDQTFRLFIEHGPVTDIAIAGPFSAYGLSHGATTVPWF
ncbi:MAG: type I-F CRISPR-associated endoribonuclease Cas6/Csy4 [Burkholderiaceae bacterium]|nr:type I-F CRISPR-associated endoribonuclease Cas6/Csy4 [Burkholderiaceae bacterium]